MSKVGYYTVEKILDHRMMGDGSFMLLIKWEGYDNSQNTYEPPSNVYPTA